jgi:PKHD-type hydroxylase
MVEPIVLRPQLARQVAPEYEPVQVHPAVFSDRQCDRIVELGSSLPSDDAGLEGAAGESTSDDSLRLSRTAWIPYDESSAWIYRKLALVADRANRRYRFELTGFEEDLQFTSYDRPGAFYTWHQDGLDATVANRKLSLVVQLSDPSQYEGGELEVFATAEHAHRGDPAPDPSAARGTVVVFPSFELHRVCPLRSGVRHSLVSWVSGPPFR